MSMKTTLWMFGTIILCGVLILVGVTMGLLPQFAAAKSTESLAQSTEDTNVIQQAQLAQLQAAKDNSGELSTQLMELRKAIPDLAASSALVEDLRGFEVESGARITEFLVKTPLNGDEAAAAAPADPEADPAAAASAAGPQQIPFTISVEAATRKEVMEFVRELQAGDRLILGETVVLSVESGDEALWTATLTGKMYAHLPK